MYDELADMRYETAKHLLSRNSDVWIKYYNVYPTGTVTLKVGFMWRTFAESMESQVVREQRIDGTVARLTALADYTHRSGSYFIFGFCDARERNSQAAMRKEKRS